jgi:phosphoglycerol geranylgeranyltransferase
LPHRKKTLSPTPVKNNIYRTILASKKKGEKLFSVLVDPDKFSAEVIRKAHKAKVNFIFIGGSKIKNGNFHHCVSAIKKLTNIPLVIFPGSREQVSEKAEAILLLSLISGRNPDYLIGEHIKAARQLKRSRLEIIPTGYILIGGGKKVSTQTVTRTSPIKNSNRDLVVSTAIAGELLGMKMIYLEAGSGATNSLDASLVKQVTRNISAPVIAGGGIDTPEKARALCKAGADMIVVGNAIEKNSNLVSQISNIIRAL